MSMHKIEMIFCLGTGFAFASILLALVHDATSDRPKLSSARAPEQVIEQAPEPLPTWRSQVYEYFDPKTGNRYLVFTRSGAVHALPAPLPVALPTSTALPEK